MAEEVQKGKVTCVNQTLFIGDISLIKTHTDFTNTQTIALKIIFGE